MRTSVLIALSGQTRDINSIDNLDRLLYYINECFPRDQYDVDIVGHTWSDQPLPNNTEPFLEIAQTDQDEIVQWVMQDLGLRLPFRTAWNHNSEYTSMDNNQLVEHLKNSAKGVYGQVWSFWESMRLAVKAMSNKRYSAVIKWRWDTGLMPVQTNHQPELLDVNIKEFTRLFNDYVNRVGPWQTYEHAVDGICASPAVLPSKGKTTAYIPDHVFWFSTQATKDIANTPVTKTFDAVCERNAIMIPSSHAMWAEYIYELDINLMAVFPDIFTCFYDTDKPNKRWRI